MTFYSHTRKLALAGAIGLTIGIGPAMAEGSSSAITEARQEAQIWTTYALSPYLKAHDIKVVVEDGVATLTGDVAEEVNKDLATQIALGVNGIHKVDNKIVVDADYVPTEDSAERSFANVVEDASITTAVKSKLLWSRHAQGLSAKVETLDGRVALSGTANTSEAKELAGVLARNTRGVVAIDNNLVVDADHPTLKTIVGETTNNMSQDISDTWITAKVKSNLRYSSIINGSLVDVSTSNGKVTLTGEVNNVTEHVLAVQLAGNVRGVDKVDHQGLSHP